MPSRRGQDTDQAKGLKWTGSVNILDRQPFFTSLYQGIVEIAWTANLAVVKSLAVMAAAAKGRG